VALPLAEFLYAVAVASELSHEVVAACSRGRQPTVPAKSTGQSHEVAAASVVVACYRHFVASLDRPWI